jgi:adenylate cyclase
VDGKENVVVTDHGDKDSPEHNWTGKPEDPESADRNELVALALELGATPETVALITEDLDELVLDLTLRPRGQATLGEVVGLLHLQLSQAQNLMRAVGLPDDPQQLLTEDEVTALTLLAADALDLLGETATIQLARVAGNAMSRLAETLVGGIRLQVQLPRRDSGSSSADLVQEYASLAQTLLPEFLHTLDAILRRQIVEVMKRVWSTDEDRSAVTQLRTVGFVDLVGYTEAAASLSVRELTDVLIAFDEQTADSVRRGNGQIIKTIGDEAMFVTEQPDDACWIAKDLVQRFGREGIPPVRVGLATGEMVSIFGDLYGPDVNLAARLVSVADSGSAIVSERTRNATGTFRFDPVPPQELKGFPAPVRAFRLL